MTIEFEQRLDGVLSTLRTTLLSKRAAYGTKNISDQGISGVIRRIKHDKLERLGRLVASCDLQRAARELGIPDAVTLPYLVSPEDESMLDTLLDVAGYAVVGTLLLRGEWGEQDAHDNRG